jgi:hypothetical protein
VKGPPRHKRKLLRKQEREEIPMTIVGGFDVHRAQITFDYLDTETGAVNTGQIRPATRLALRRWLAERFAGRGGAALAVEGCTGWRFVVEELVRAGVEAHLAEPADTATLRGRKQRAKTDHADARLLRELLAQGRLPESWVPPAQVWPCPGSTDRLTMPPEPCLGSCAFHGIGQASPRNQVAKTPGIRSSSALPRTRPASGS